MPARIRFLRGKESTNMQQKLRVWETAYRLLPRVEHKRKGLRQSLAPANQYPRADAPVLRLCLLSSDNVPDDAHARG